MGRIPSMKSYTKFADSIRVGTISLNRSNRLKVTTPGGRKVLYEGWVNLGGYVSARRTNMKVAKLFAVGCRVFVLTSKGWSERGVIIGRDGSPYLRMNADLLRSKVMS